jgi:branched-chain amino acid transport system ATP-binding protein
VSLRLEGVTAGYGGSTVLQDVSLTVPEGRSVALVGANGAGKSTLLAVASGLLPARAGRVLLDGVDLGHRRPEERVALGLCHVTEGGAVFPALTVADNLRIFTPAGRAVDGVERALDAFPALGERLGQVAGTLSGGEQRMLALARVYAAGATTILLDEVSLGLAPMLVDEVFAFLARLAGEGISLLVVEQYVGRVLELADLVYVLTRGRVAFAGEPGELDEHRLAEQYLA